MNKSYRNPKDLPDLRLGFTIVLLGSGLLLLLGASPAAWAQPEPGDVFREYTFTPQESFFSELNPDTERDFDSSSAFYLDRPHAIKELSLDLEGATRAEMSVEYWGGHIGTSEQRFRVNGNAWTALPQPKGTPGAPECYFRTLLGAPVPVPLEQLRGGANQFQFHAGPQRCHSFNWGMYWIYSFTVRVYYNPSEVDHPTGRITAPASGTELHENPVLAASASSPNASVNRVDFIGRYRDFDWEGNGVFRQWHYQTQQGRWRKHIGTAERPDYKVVWNTKWVPDQNRPVQLMAKITDNRGVSYMTPTVEAAFARPNRSVKMYPCQEVPEYFGVRTGSKKSCTISVDNDLSEATAARLMLSTWSAVSHSSSVHGIRINGALVANNFGRFHDYSFDLLDPALENVEEGANEITIYSESDGHPLEVNWPGPALFVEYR